MTWQESCDSERTLDVVGRINVVTSGVLSLNPVRM